MSIQLEIPTRIVRVRNLMRRDDDETEERPEWDWLKK